MADDGEVRRRRRRPRRRPRGGAGGGGGGDGKRPGNGAAPTGEGGSEAQSGPIRRSGRPRSRGRSGGQRGSNSGRGGRSGGQGSGRGRGQRNTGRGRPRRGRVAENWWARRWVEVLESFEVGRRLGRGRTYARSGQVVDLDIGKGFVNAHVQGSRDAPYLVRMHFSMLSSTDWKKITRALAERPEIASELGTGNIPETIESVFQEQGLSLFPAASGDLKAACSCPDAANPCKHVAAVYYLLGEEFDRDPFLVFRIRGLDHGELLAALGPAAIPRAPAAPPRPEPPAAEPMAGDRVPSGSAADADAADVGADDTDAAPIVDLLEPPPEREPPVEPLPEDPEVFWGGGVRVGEEEIEVRIPATPGALASRLGGFPFWRGQANCTLAMIQIYRNASLSGLDVYLGAGEIRDAEEG